jgi:hypothetical protein
MRLNLVIFALALCLAAQAAAPQPPTVSVIEYYGLSRVPLSRIEAALGVKPGAPLPASKGDAEARLEAVDGVVAARLEAVCCEAGGAILFVGILEKGARLFEVRDPPEVNVLLPLELAEAYQSFLETYRDSALRPGAPGLSPITQSRLAALANKHARTVREVVRNSVDADHRAMAAHLLVFLKDKAAAAEDLQYALRDPDEGVRQNALRALKELAAYAAAHPEDQIKISPTWPVEMLSSLVWADRTGAAELLVALSENRDAGVLGLLRERALPQLFEMARWQTLQYALPSYILLGRLAGLTEEQIQQSWASGQRLQQLAAIEKSLAASR